MVLFIDACARPQSRTRMLAETACEMMSDSVKRIDLFQQNLRPLDGETLAKREAFVCSADYTDDMFRFARQFKDADEIVIAAPYWDLSFPAVLKCYLEAICVNGLTCFNIMSMGYPKGCAKPKGWSTSPRPAVLSRSAISDSIT